MPVYLVEATTYNLAKVIEAITSIFTAGFSMVTSNEVMAIGFFGSIVISLLFSSLKKGKNVSK